MKMLIAVLAGIVVAACAAGNPAQAQTQGQPVGAHTEQHTRYLGTPDLGLTAALVEAGGGAQHFDAGQLVGVLTGPKHDAEVARLTQLYGAERVGAFLKTFTFAIDDTLQLAGKNNVALPAATPGLATDGRALATALYAAGTMSDGKFDVGYMIEHLISRNLHVQLMRDINADANYGPQVNADFHQILTTAMYDLKSAYGAG